MQLEAASVKMLDEPFLLVLKQDADVPGGTLGLLQTSGEFAPLLLKDGSSRPVESPNVDNVINVHDVIKTIIIKICNNLAIVQ